MKRLIVLAVTFVLCGIVSVQAAGDEKNGHAYFTKAQLPNMANILPAPPEFESARFVADQSQYLWGKLMRLDEARCAQAQRDAVYSMETIIAEFSGIFGLEITKEDTPEIYTILQDVCASCDSIHTDAKVFFNLLPVFDYFCHNPYDLVNGEGVEPSPPCRLLLDNDDFGGYLAQLLHDARDVVAADVLHDVVGTGRLKADADVCAVDGGVGLHVDFD